MLESWEYGSTQAGHRSSRPHNYLGPWSTRSSGILESWEYTGRPPEFRPRDNYGPGSSRATGALGTRVQYLVDCATRVTGLLGPLVYLNHRSTRVVGVLGPESSRLETLLECSDHQTTGVCTGRAQAAVDRQTGLGVVVLGVSSPV
jgi:hypothetical protein